MGVDIAGLIKTVRVQQDILASYVGHYLLPPTDTIKVTLEKDHLMIDDLGKRVPFIPLSETKFYSEQSSLQYAFNQDESGKIKSITVHQGGMQLVAGKVN